MFKLKDDVYSINFGWGLVKEILGAEHSSDYKVRVLFENERTESFTLDGKYFEHGLRDLFFEEIPIPKSALTRPRKSAKELLNECEELKFETGEPNFYIYFDTTDSEVCYRIYKQTFVYGVKYISEKDAKRIVKECKENNR